MRIFITGIRGFIGRNLAERLRTRGVAVSGSSRRGSEGVVAHRLGEPLPPGALDGVDALVHLAHDFGADAFAANVEGTKALFRQAREAGVERRLFISSYSAHPGATSLYGKTKWALERALEGEGVTVVRPGLVVGDGGLFARLARLVGALPLVPLLDGGRARMPVVGIDDLSDALFALASAPSGGGDFNLSNDQAPPFGDLLRRIGKARGSRRLYFPLPARPLLWPLEVAEGAGLKLPVTSENLRGLIANAPVVRESSLSRLIDRELPLDESIRRALIRMKERR